MVGEAAAAVGAWDPEDDVLLKNAVEAGASLESLAKGAVHFSRRFTVQELQDRWYSILYDPVVAEEASKRMSQLECAATTTPNTASKVSRLGNTKENKWVPEKRKAQSVRSSYGALRKRICSEPFDDLNFILAPSDDNCFVNGDEHLPEHVVNGYPISDHFGFEGSDMGAMHHAFQQNLMDSTDIGGIISTDIFQNGGLEQPEEEDFLVEQDDLHEEIPSFGDDLHITSNGCEVEEFGQAEELPDCGMFSSDDLGMQPPCSLDQIRIEDGNLGSTFEGNRVYSVSTPDSGASFHNLEYSTQLPKTGIWSTVPAPAMSVDGGTDTFSGDAFQLYGDTDTKKATTSGYGVDLGMEMKVGDFHGPASTEDYLEELSNSLLNFTNEEELMFKDDIDKSYYDGLSSLLMSSPKDNVDNVGEVHMMDLSEPIMHPLIPSSTDSGVEYGVRVGLSGDEHMQCHPGTLMQTSSTAYNYQFPECKDGVISCTLNTEQWEIPCNDDVFLLNHVPSSSTSSQVKWNEGASKPKPKCSSDKNLTVNQKTDTGPCSMQKEQGDSGKYLMCFQIKGPNCLPQVGVKLPLCNFELSKTDPVVVASTSSAHPSGNRGQIDSVEVSTDHLPGILNEEPGEGKLINFEYTATGSHMDNSHLGYDSVKSFPQPSATGINQERDELATIEGKLLHAEVMLEVNTMTLDFDGLFDSDDDVPCYSDVEAMILDMDLDPNDLEIPSGEEVSRYQDEDTKRSIMRLEQGAYSYMQRAIASHGAFAILYGRRSKHYIKKREVLLGRVSEEHDIVDIDLTIEGRGNKCSRRQAKIQMEKDGSFYLQNLGRLPIYVNSTELTQGESVRLSSSCLIEIRGVSFIFETNQACVKKYLNSITQS